MRFALFALLLASFACDSRPRRDTGVSLNDDLPGASEATNVYRFVGVSQSLSDARKAMAEERWGMALVAARALLRQEAGHIEAQKIADRATFEAMNQMHFDVFQRSVASKDFVSAGTHCRQISAESLYFERARPEYEKVRDQWVAARETEIRAMTPKGRCRDAHHVARSASDSFPEVRARLDSLADNCRPAVGQEAEPEAAAAAAAAQPAAAVVAAVAPVKTSPPIEPRPEPPKVAPAAATVSPSVPPPAAPRPVGPKMIPAFELEKLRVAGERKPLLTAGARGIASREGVKQITAALAFCVSATGVPEHVELMKATEYPDMNEKIVGDVTAWRFHPYTSGDGPVPVCTRVVFLWQLE